MYLVAVICGIAGGYMVFEFGAVRFRPVEREDLKLLHGWENDFLVIMFSRGRPLNFVNMPQLEKMYEEWIKDEKQLHFIIEIVESGDKTLIFNTFFMFRYSSG